MELFKNLIGGEWVAGAAENININPSDVSDTVGIYANGGEAQMEDAIEAASQAFPAWRVTNVARRAEILYAVSAELFARKEELGELLAREEGKTRADATGEVIRAAQLFRFYAGECLRDRGDKLDSIRDGAEVEVIREPLGVVGIITPWNFPIAIPAWKIAPALAYGNTVVFKPASLVPASAWALVDILHRCGVPHGVVNLVMSPGRVANALVTDKRVKGISFTGSTGVGRRLASQAVEHFAKIQLELGGKSPMVVLDDADMEAAIAGAFAGLYTGTGQKCTASSRFIVTRGVYDEFVSRLTAKVQSARVGHALAADTVIGPVVDESQLRTNEHYISQGRAAGATLTTGGERLQREHDGFYFSPAVFADADNSMSIAQEEIFGPIGCVIPADDYDHALALANDTEFGLVAAIYTQSLKHAQHFKRHSDTGMVTVNLPTSGGDYRAAFGGRKASGYGPKEQGPYVQEFYTQIKCAHVLG
ncbi:aldehyde dehydrogenase [Leisingera sp. ANG-M1]|uniref:aldehyde dehydrogenase family protein n=1 Tax=Leisingera sp. ANG-M1 TaxID=1577895 RepID=UPI00057FE8CF|nr:aldehyde dehydrogenase family protein [Leisingera sp. ANG-M1]KIC07345.1 aldehyde dehydrogenase [Leisingera sp. ANG-M1]